MDLKHYTHKLIYEGKDMPLSDNLARFKIVCPEYAPHEIEVKPYPMPAAEHIFALMWDISPQHVVSATLLPSASHFLYSKEFTPGMKTQMHSHEYLELFYIMANTGRKSLEMNTFSTRVSSV